MIICVLLIADSALEGINYFINQLILNYTPFIYYINSRKPKTSINQGLSGGLCGAACSLSKDSYGEVNFPRRVLNSELLKKAPVSNRGSNIFDFRYPIEACKPNPAAKQKYKTIVTSK